MATFLGGFSPLKYSNGAPWNSTAKRYVAAGNMFVGDFVKMTLGSQKPTGPGLVSAVPLKNVIAATSGATESVIGVVVGKVVNPLNLNTQIGLGAPITSGEIILVVDDPEVIYSGQLSGAAPFNAAQLNFNTVINTTTPGANGRSGQKVDAAMANGATAPLRVVGFVDSPDNNYQLAGTTLMVQINNYQFSMGGAGAGV